MVECEIRVKDGDCPAATGQDKEKLRLAVPRQAENGWPCIPQKPVNIMVENFYGFGLKAKLTGC